MSKSEKLLIKKLKKPIKTPLNIRLCLKNIELNILKIRLKSELKEYQKQGADIRVKIEELDKNKPMFFGKKDWSEKRENLVREYSEIKHLHDHTKNEKRYNAFMINALGVKQ